ncbi:MAG: hypothetical protein C3F13_08650 [Anaerolineales bacterium]|nr:hypothetical protein [Anaerolineae bacterium]PWB53476.1 MAG: hypothetical protein C3F13_08650 [Anaerolineales bacterium]
MIVKFSGTVYYANGDPISGVIVRIFDKDAVGKQDDDLTMVQGISDVYGCFTLTYEPLRYLDYHTIHLPGGSEDDNPDEGSNPGYQFPDLGDIYLPYLQFNYTINSIDQVHTASLGLFRTKFILPVHPPVNFVPSKGGFKFPNCFNGYFLPYSTPDFLSPKVPPTYGLCGGMCAAAYDFALSGRLVPSRAEAPHQGTRLQRYLYHRQMDSLGGLGQQAIKVAQWTSLPSDTLLGTYRRTFDEFSILRQKLSNGNPVILALIYEQATSIKQLSEVIFKNHQVLAYAYQEDPAGAITLQVYDPNLPGHDDVVIRAEPVEMGESSPSASSETVRGLQSTQLVGGGFYRDVRGFFEMPYTPVKPPQGL